MRGSIRLLFCLSMLAAAACVPDAVTGPRPAAPAPERQVQAASRAVEIAQAVEAAPAPKAGPRTILLRGTRSVTADRTREPLYIVDGVVVSGDALGEIDAADIESIQVLKGASLAQLYGRRLENGVVIITTTRRGRSR